MNGRARKLRQSQTDAEKLLWYRVRNRRLEQHKFRRQHPIGPYVVDFVCLTAKLIVELDGGQHADSVAKDQRRSEYLRNQGFRVLRFWNNEVMTEIDAVLEKIRIEALTPALSQRERE